MSDGHPFDFSIAADLGGTFMIVEIVTASGETHIHSISGIDKYCILNTIFSEICWRMKKFVQNSGGNKEYFYC